MKYDRDYDGEPGFWVERKRVGEGYVFGETLASEQSQFYDCMLNDNYDALRLPHSKRPSMKDPVTLQREATLISSFV